MQNLATSSTTIHKALLSRTIASYTRIKYTYIGCAEKSDARQVLSDNKYAYDSNGRLITKETLDGTTRYSYNEVNALVKVEYPDYGETFEYDRAGNRTGHTFGDTKER